HSPRIAANGKLKLTPGSRTAGPRVRPVNEKSDCPKARSPAQRAAAEIGQSRRVYPGREHKVSAADQKHRILHQELLRPGRSGSDRHLYHAVKLVGKQLVGFFDLVELESMGH